MREVDLVGDGQPGTVGLERHAAVAVNDLDGAGERDRTHARRLSLEACGVEELARTES
jgi:hypothetical protein